jgi:predicted DNA-binding transcriptional regulator AlpA
MTDFQEKSVLDERVITVDELAALLRVSTTTIYARLGGWPHMRIVDRGTIRFRESQVEEIFELMTKKPVVVDEMARIRLRRQIGTMAQRRRYGAM